MHKLVFPCNILVSGSTSSGKTTLVKRWLNDKTIPFDHLVVCSPTAQLSGDWAVYKDRKDVEVHDVKIGAVIAEVVKKNKSYKTKYGITRTPHVVLLLDDLLGSSHLTQGGVIAKEAVRARHFNVSLIVLTQRLAGIPRQFRINSRYTICFALTNYSELERFLVELVPARVRKAFAAQIEAIYSVPYTFVLVNAFESNINRRLFLNGKEPLTF